MATRLYIGGLSQSSTNESLEALFGQFGMVRSATIITDRDTDKSRGFAFIEMDTEESAQEAINTLNDTAFEGSQVSVTLARPRV